MPGKQKQWPKEVEPIGAFKYEFCLRFPANLNPKDVAFPCFDSLS